MSCVDCAGQNDSIEPQNDRFACHFTKYTCMLRESPMRSELRPRSCIQLQVLMHHPHDRESYTLVATGYIRIVCGSPSPWKCSSATDAQVGVSPCMLSSASKDNRGCQSPDHAYAVECMRLLGQESQTLALVCALALPMIALAKEIRVVHKGLGSRAVCMTNCIFEKPPRMSETRPRSGC